MKKSSMLCGLIIGIGVLLTGCSNPFDHMPDLTEEESGLIAEYAAGILIKHDKYAGRLVNDAEIVAADEREVRLKASAEAFSEMEKEEEQNKAEENASHKGTGEAAGAEEVETPFLGIAEFCGAEGFQITYIGHMICDSYPEDTGEERVFAMDATEGNKLLVLKFTAENESGEEQELDILNKNVRFRIAVNDASPKSALSTLLLDDLASYKEVIPPETGVELVLIREITQEEAASVNSISLFLQNASENATTLLE